MELINSEGTPVQIVDAWSILLTEVSWPGSIHSIEIEGKSVEATFEFEQHNDSRYGGPIVLYIIENQYYMRPTYEFFDGRYLRK